MAFVETAPYRSPVWYAATGLLLLSLAAIATALAFEHIGGYAPCPLCLKERIAYYFAIPASAAALLALRAAPAGLAEGMARLILALIAVAYLVNAGLGIYHAGVEWHFWPGPTDCSGGGGLERRAGALLDSLAETRVIRCDEAPFRLFGLSFAGWNAVLSLGFAAIAILGIVWPRRR